MRGQEQDRHEREVAGDPGQHHERTASITYSAGNVSRGVCWSSRATTSGASSAGTNCEHKKNAAAPSALPVRA